jgi:hypothetical protein
VVAFLIPVVSEIPDGQGFKSSSVHLFAFPFNSFEEGWWFWFWDCFSFAILGDVCLEVRRRGSESEGIHGRSKQTHRRAALDDSTYNVGERERD